MRLGVSVEVGLEGVGVLDAAAVPVPVPFAVEPVVAVVVADVVVAVVQQEAVVVQQEAVVVQYDVAVVRQGVASAQQGPVCWVVQMLVRQQGSRAGRLQTQTLLLQHCQEQQQYQRPQKHQGHCWIPAEKSVAAEATLWARAGVQGRGLWGAIDRGAPGRRGPRRPHPRPLRKQLLWARRRRSRQ